MGKLAGIDIECSISELMELTRFVRPQDVNFQGFLQFKENSTKSRILAFAKKYGPLGFCQHGLPPMHLMCCYCQPKIENGWIREPIDAWQKVAEQFSYLKELSLRTQKGQQALWKEWVSLFRGSPIQFPFPQMPEARRARKFDRRLLGTVLGAALFTSGLKLSVQPLYSFGDSKDTGIHRLCIQPSSLYDALLLRLISVFTDSWIAFCPSCGNEFRKAHGKQIWCSDTCRFRETKRRKRENEKSKTRQS